MSIRRGERSDQQGELDFGAPPLTPSHPHAPEPSKLSSEREKGQVSDNKSEGAEITREAAVEQYLQEGLTQEVVLPSVRQMEGGYAAGYSGASDFEKISSTGMGWINPDDEFGPLVLELRSGTVLYHENVRLNTTSPTPVQFRVLNEGIPHLKAIALIKAAREGKLSPPTSEEVH